MDLEFCINQLADQAEMTRALAGRAAPEQARWKPNPETWSLLEVMNHLYREERGDFRLHLSKFASRTGDPFPPVDLPGVAESEADLNSLTGTLQGFLEEREKSLNWLKRLESPDWDASLELPLMDTSRKFTAGELLASWVAHDLLHLRQLVEVQWAYATRRLEPYPIEYAGGW